MSVFISRNLGLFSVTDSVGVRVDILHDFNSKSWVTPGSSLGFDDYLTCVSGGVVTAAQVS